MNFTPYAARDSSVVISSQQCPNVVNVTGEVETRQIPFSTLHTPLAFPLFSHFDCVSSFFYAKKRGEVIKKKFRATPLSLLSFSLEQIFGIPEISKLYPISRKVWESSTFYFQNCFGYFFRIIFFQIRLRERKDVIVSSLSRNEEKKLFDVDGGRGKLKKNLFSLFLFTAVISQKIGEKFFFAKKERKESGV